MTALITLILLTATALFAAIAWLRPPTAAAAVPFLNRAARRALARGTGQFRLSYMRLLPYRLDLA